MNCPNQNCKEGKDKDDMMEVYINMKGKMTPTPANTNPVTMQDLTAAWICSHCGAIIILPQQRIQA